MKLYILSYNHLKKNQIQKRKRNVSCNDIFKIAPLVYSHKTPLHTHLCLDGKMI